MGSKNISIFFYIHFFTSDENRGEYLRFGKPECEIARETLNFHFWFLLQQMSALSSDKVFRDDFLRFVLVASFHILLCEPSLNLHIAAIGPINGPIKIELLVPGTGRAQVCSVELYYCIGKSLLSFPNIRRCHWRWLTSVFCALPSRRLLSLSTCMDDNRSLGTSDVPSPCLSHSVPLTSDQ